VREVVERVRNVLMIPNEHPEQEIVDVLHELLRE